MKNLHFQPHVLLLAAAAVCGSAHADRPLVSETADALPARQCQAEMGSALASDKKTASVREADLLLSCGVLSNTQLALGLSRSRQHSQSEYGTTLTGKTTWVAPADGKPGFGVRYGAAWSQLPGQGSELTEFHLLALATQEIGSGVLAHANLGFSRSRSRATQRNTTLWSIGIETTADLVLAADLYGDDRSKPWVSAGIGYSLGHGLSLSASLARQLQEPRGRLFTLGVKMVF